MERDIDRPRSPGDSPQDRPLPSGRLSLEDVLDVEEQSIRSSLGAVAPEALHFEGLESTIAAASSTLRGARAVDQGGDGAVAAEQEGGDGLGAEELRELVAIYEHAGRPGPFSEGDAVHLERAAVLLHLAAEGLGFRGEGGFAARDLARRLDDALREAGAEPLRDLVGRAIPDMAEALDPATFDRWMRVGIPLLQRCDPSPVESLTRMALGAAPHGRENLTPHAIDEYLTLLPRRMPPLDPRILELDPDAMERIHGRLGQLRAFGMGLFGPGAFRIDDRFAQPLVARLARTRLLGPLAPVLTAAFRESMPYDPGARACLLAHRRADDGLAWVLAAQLQDVRAPLGPEAERSAAWVLVQGLDALEDDRKQETWIPEALDWIGARDTSLDAPEQVAATARVLGRVVAERRGLRPVWARAARRSARAALAGLPFHDDVGEVEL